MRILDDVGVAASNCAVQGSAVFGFFMLRRHIKCFGKN